ncbi:fatty acid biosynthetic process [Desmophyllum pertusum]|uniref:Fatty acid biosynthetic process n=1 Tax=Desmophyllum pertusum TaxID=174260 RepID=A0A9W9ZQK4_9CNID|nr:fatty acid biosynthetic process [Desmophyllum pertusum]
MPPYGKAGSVDDLLLDDDKKDEEISPDKPSINQLNLLVKDVILRTSWWDLYGIDLAIMCANFALLPVSYHLIGSGSILLFMIGFLLLAYIHATFTMKLAHAAIHNALAGSSHFWNRLLTVFFVEIWGGFTGEGSYEAHIQLHHPYTNVIGLGDSSSWRAPFLGRVTYLFIAPLFLPLLNTMIGVSLLAGRWWSIARLLCLATAGYVMHFCLFRYVAGLSIFGSILCMFTTRSVFYIPYIHVNIFQHIGLPMYDVKKRPQATLPVIIGCPQSSKKSTSGLCLWSLDHQLPRGTSFIPTIVRQHVSKDKTSCVQLSQETMAFRTTRQRIWVNSANFTKNMMNLWCMLHR